MPSSPPRTVSRTVVRTATAGTVVLATGAFVLSFAALSDLGRRAGIAPSLAWIWPLIVDGLIVVATVAIIALAGHPRRVLAYPWTLLLAGAAVSVAANSTHAVLTSTGLDDGVPLVVSALVAAVPPLVLLAVTHLSVVLIAHQGKPARRSTGPRAKAKPPVAPVVSIERTAAQ